MADKTVNIRLVAQVGQYVSGMAQATAATGAFQGAAGASQGAVGGLAGKIGKFTPMLAAGGGLAFAMKEVAGTAIEWESAFAGVRKTVDGTEQQLSGLSDGLREMSTQIPTSAEDLAGIAEAAGQLGIETENIESFTRTMADLGETTNLTGEQAASSLARFVNIVGTSQTDFDRLGSSIVELGNNFATTESEIVDMAMRIAGAGAQVGLTEGEILGLSTALSSVGVNAEAGGSAISRVMINMASEVAEAGDKLQGLADVAGMTADQFAQLFRDDPDQAIAAFVQGLDRIAESGGNVFAVLEDLGMDEIRVRDALLRLAGAGDLVADAMERGNDGFERNIALTEEAQQRYDTAAAKIQTTKNTIKDLAREIALGLTPAIGDLAEMVGNAAGIAGDMIDPISDFVSDANRLLDDVLPGQGTFDWGKGMEVGFDALPGITGGMLGQLDEVGTVLDRFVKPDFNREAQKQQMANYTGQLDDMAAAAGKAAEANDDLAGKMGDVGEAGHEAAAGIAASAEEAMKVADPVFALFDAWRDYEDAVLAADEAIAKHGASSHEAVQKSQDVASALMELQHLADTGAVSWDTFERTLATWVEQGHIAEETAYSIMHGVDHARDAAVEFAGDYDARLGLEGADEARRQLEELGMVAAAIADTYTIRVNVETPSLAGRIPVGSGRVTSSTPTSTAGGGGYVTGGGGGGIPRAAGGPVWPGQNFLVGERGPEMLRMGHGGFGSITPLPAPPVHTRGGDGTTIGRQMLVQDGAVQIVARDSQQAATEASWELRKLALELGG